MKVILLEDVDRLGRRGSIQNVANGYGRNFLIPRNLAVAATEANMKLAQAQTKKVEVQEAKEEKSAGQLKSELENVSVTISMKAGEGDMLFGSVTTANIAEALEKQGFTIDKRRIEMEEPIKRLGDHKVTVKLHKNVAAEIKVSVTKE